MALNVLAKMAHQFRHAQDQRSVHVLPVAMEFPGAHPGFTLEHNCDLYHRSTSVVFHLCGFLITESGQPCGGCVWEHHGSSPYNSPALSGTIVGQPLRWKPPDP